MSSSATALALRMAPLALLLSLAACDDRPGGLPYLTLAQCMADDGRVVPMGDAGAEMTCGPDALLIGRIDPDDADGADLGCCQ
jgi:hypothetical protein